MDIYFSPSLEVENKANKNGLTISAVGDPEDPEFYIFYKRPISVVKKQFFRKPQTVVEDYISEITGQTKEDVIECLNALIKNDLEFLRRKNCIKSSTPRINEIESLLDKQNTEAKSNFWKIVA